MDDQTKDQLKADIEKMKEIPWSYEHLADCECGSDDMKIAEFDDGNFNFYCGSVECNKCGLKIEATNSEPADLIWNRKHNR